MSKTGILTYYYKTHNYGGMLQSYALPYFLKKNGINAEQICYVRTDERPFTIKELRETNNLSFFTRLKNKILFNKYIQVIKPKFEERNKKFLEFELKIPHCREIYNLASICQANDIYDNFVVESDQIWTFNCFNPTFFGEFVSKDKKLISYAASVGKSNFTDEECNYLSRTIPRFDAISVRESDLINDFSNISKRNDIECVVDPTFLLDRSEWDEICSNREISERYMFCYFLGGDVRLRRLAKRYAKKHKLKIVSIPFANETFNNADFNYYDIGKFDADPSDFISLIKFSDCVFTDSFHATVFSLIYNKEFFVFDRVEHKNMCSRLYTLTKLFDCEERFCDCDYKFSLDYIDDCDKINYNIKFIEFEKQKTKSIDFLINNLK